VISDNYITFQPIVFNGGTFSALSKSQTFGTLTLAAPSTINLEPGNGAGVLRFAGVRSPVAR